MIITYRSDVSDFDLRYRADPNLDNSKGHVTIQQKEWKHTGKTGIDAYYPYFFLVRLSAKLTILAMLLS